MGAKMNIALLLAGTMTTIFLLSGCREEGLTNIEENTSSYLTRFITKENLIEESKDQIYNQESSKQDINDQESKDQDSGDEKLSLKIFVNFGMDEEYDVLSMDENTVTYSYFNYENTDVPQIDQKTVNFDELMTTEQGERVYLFYMYLEEGTKKI